MLYYGFVMIVGNELAPVKFSQYIYAAVLTLLGSLFMAWIFGSITATLASMNHYEGTF